MCLSDNAGAALNIDATIMSEMSSREMVRVNKDILTVDCVCTFVDNNTSCICFNANENVTLYILVLRSS